MATDKKRKPAPAGLDAPYIRGDALASTVAIELNSDVAWDMFQEAQAAQEAKFAATAPMQMPLPSPAPASADPRFAETEPATLRAEYGGVQPPDGPRGLKVKPLTVDDAMTEARKNNRVCPVPARWQELYDRLPGRKATQPTPPLVGASWKATPSISKRMCLREHLEWAEAKGCLVAVMLYLRALPETEWHHMGE